MILQTKKISRLLNDLKHPDASKRRTAVETLSDGDERVIYPLINALRDENTGVQDAAMQSLISIGGEVTVYMVLPLLRDEPFLRNTAIIILKEIGAVAVLLFYPLLNDKDDDVRKFAIDLICEIKQCNYPQEIARLLLNDPNPNVRTSAAKAIGILQYKDALPQLITALNDDEWVCFSALESLSMIKDESSIEPILSLLDSPSDVVRTAAIEALGIIRSPLASNALLNHIPKTDGFEKTAAIKSLIHIGITPPLSALLVSEVSDELIDIFSNGDWDERLIVLKGLIDLKENRAIETIIDIAGSLDPSEPESEERLIMIKDALRGSGCIDVFIDILNNPSIRYRGKAIAIEVLGDLRCEKAVPHLIRLLEEDLRDVRRASMKALGEMKDDKASQTLMGAIDDHDGHVRKIAVAALGRIDKKRSVEPLLRLLHVERYSDVIEETVKSLLLIDSSAVYSYLGEFSSHIKDVIGRHADDPDILLSLSRDEDLKVKASAISGFGKIQAEKAYRRLAEAIQEDEPEVRKVAVRAASELNCCHDEIRLSLNDEDMWVRLYAVKALGRSFRDDIIKTLTPMLDDRDIPVVLSTIDAIAPIGGAEALEILNPLLNHSDKGIREKAQEAIEGGLQRKIFR